LFFTSSVRAITWQVGFFKNHIALIGFMKIAVVILNWNGRKLLETFLPSLVRYSKEASLYVVDNASSDDSISFVRTNFPEVQVVVNTENGGIFQGL
jgi:GT2 family glycosyltransferase